MNANSPKESRFQGLRTAKYAAPDLASAKAWYAQVLGQQPYFDEPFYVGFSVGGFELGLDPDMTGVTHGTGHVAYWGVPDCAAEYRRLIGLGATPLQEPQDVGGGIVIAAVNDPFGNPFGIIQNPHFGSGSG